MVCMCQLVLVYCSLIKIKKNRRCFSNNWIGLTLICALPCQNYDIMNVERGI